MENYEHLIIGGGLAGGYAAGIIRENDDSGPILLVTDEAYPPYDRVPLSKGHLMGKISDEQIFIEDEDFYSSHKIEVLKCRKAIALDVPRHTVKLDNNTEISFNRLLLATGGRIRRLSICGSDLQRIFYLRTIPDSNAIRGAMQESDKTVVIGGGFIGCELASAFAHRDIETTIVETTGALLGRVFDAETAKWIEGYFSEHSVRVMTNTAPKRFMGKNGVVSSVEDSNGRLISADFVTVGIGINPNIDLAEAAGLEVNNGIVVNESLETSAPGIYAAGDVANFYSPVLNQRLRVEHYDVAVSQGEIAGANMAGGSQVVDVLPHFFSYFFDLRFDVYGDMSRHDTVVRRGHLNAEGGFVQFYLEDGIVNAVMLMNRSEDLKAINQIVSSRRRLEDLSFLSKDLTLDEIAKIVHPSGA